MPTQPPKTVEMPVLPIGDNVVYPDSMAPLVIGRERSLRLMDHVGETDSNIVLVAARPDVVDAGDGEFGPEALYEVGTEAQVHRIIRVNDGSVRVLVQGTRRVRITDWVRDEPFLTAEVSPLPDTGRRGTREIEAITRELVEAYEEAVSLAPYLPDELRIVAGGVETPGELCHLVASTLKLDIADKQQLLEITDLRERLRKTLSFTTRELEMLRLGSRIRSEVHTEISRSQRDFYLRQQLKQIQEELGEGAGDELDELREKLDAAGLPAEARAAADRELERLARTPEQGAEHGVIRTYLETLAELPWNTVSEDNLDLEHARKVLDRDHHDLEKVKERALDFLAVSQLTQSLSGPIICFVGPPGVGKTSLGRSIADALGRRFQRISAGGVRDESEIRGHRRTYIGSMPGSIIRSLRDAGTRNPVFMIDEIDKMGSDWRGDPASAMLEVLDPEQNATFRDHYLDLPFDLSGVLFICTANRVDTIPPALRDRMEIIRMEGYTEEDKLAIARRHLLPKQLREHGLKRGQMRIGRAELRTVIRGYTRESGVRELDRQIATLARKVARYIAEQPAQERGTVRLDVDESRIVDWLGQPRFRDEWRARSGEPGVATGLAVTAVGGDVLSVEATAMPGSGKVQITGQVGKVMEESARAAISWLRSMTASQHADAGTFFSENDIHLHVPAGAIPKDGPSAGITMAVALASLYYGIPVRDGLAMTGEITLTGQVLPVGGIKDKVLAAQRAGCREVVVPDRNEADLVEVPEQLARGMTFHVVDHIDQVLEVAFDSAALASRLDSPRRPAAGRR